MNVCSCPILAGGVFEAEEEVTMLASRLSDVRLGTIVGYVSVPGAGGVKLADIVGRISESDLTLRRGIKRFRVEVAMSDFEEWALSLIEIQPATYSYRRANKIWGTDE